MDEARHSRYSNRSYQFSPLPYSPFSDRDEEVTLGPRDSVATDIQLSNLNRTNEETIELLENSQQPPAKTPTLSTRLDRILDRFQGWKGGLALALIADCIVLFSLTISVLAFAYQFDRDGMEVHLFDGTCSSVKPMSTWVHLLINILSTLLLSSSSYAIQCLVAPTRLEVDRAHRKGRHVGIGMFSWRNLRSVSRPRAMMCAVIAITSIPIHLFANSTVYSTQGTNAYYTIVVSKDFETVVYSKTSLGTRINQAVQADFHPTIIGPFNATDQASHFWTSSDAGTRLEKEKCIKTYSDPLMSGYQNVIIVSSLKMSDLNTTKHFIADMQFRNPLPVFANGTMTYTDPSLWTCEFGASTTYWDTNKTKVKSCDAQEAVNNASSFRVAGNRYPVEYCLAEEVDESCLLDANLAMATVVLCCTLLKSAVVFAAWKKLPDAILATLGDAMSSFLAIPDPVTQHCSLLSKSDVSGMYHGFVRAGNERWKPGSPCPKYWRQDYLKNKWMASVNRLPLFLVFGFGIIFLAVAGKIMQLSWSKPQNSHDSILSTFWRMGIGVTKLPFIFELPSLTDSHQVMASAMLVNLPQFLLSCFYFASNQCLTGMFLGREWAAFGQKHQSLRVSDPSGVQRSNYFLTIPYRFAIPFLIFSAILHWLVSQSVFLVRLQVRQADPFVPEGYSIFNAIGYSPMSIILFITLLSMWLVTLLVTGLFKMFNSPVPVVGGCSLAISAGCHPPPEETRSKCWLKPVAWGVIPSMRRDGKTLHCALTSGYVYSPAMLEIQQDEFHPKRKYTVAIFE